MACRSGFWTGVAGRLGRRVATGQRAGTDSEGARARLHDWGGRVEESAATRADPNRYSHSGITKLIEPHQAGSRRGGPNSHERARARRALDRNQPHAAHRAHGLRPPQTALRAPSRAQSGSDSGCHSIFIRKSICKEPSQRSVWMVAICHATDDEAAGGWSPADAGSNRVRRDASRADRVAFLFLEHGGRSRAVGRRQLLASGASE